MKNLWQTAMFLCVLIFSCAKESNLDLDPTVQADDDVSVSEKAYAYKRVHWNYERNVDGIDYVNKVPTVDKIGGQHWTFRSPSLKGEEIWIWCRS